MRTAPTTEVRPIRPVEHGAARKPVKIHSPMILQVRDLFIVAIAMTGRGSGTSTYRAPAG